MILELIITKTSSIIEEFPSFYISIGLNGGKAR